MHSPDPISAGVLILLGLALTFLGRRIFWLFVGAIGFFAGLHFAPLLLAPNQPAWVLLLIGAVLGLIGALLAIFLERFAVAVAGWFAGGMLAYRLAMELGWTGEPALGIAFLIGAIVVAIVFSLLLDWALIVVTSLIGALMVCDAVPLAPTVKWLIAVVLVILGFAFQSRTLTRAPAPLAR